MNLTDTTKFIPRQVTVFRQKLFDGVCLGGRKYRASPGFAVRASASDDVKDTARAWACGDSRAWTTYRDGHRNPAWDSVTFAVFDNVPKTHYVIVGAEQRSEGGRAWKVVSPDGDLFDLREDVFLPLLLSCGLPFSGDIHYAEFQWCQNGSQLKLLAINSAEWKQFMTEDQRDALLAGKKAAKKVTKRIAVPDDQLAIGTTYDFDCPGGPDMQIFMGKCQWNDSIYYAWCAGGSACNDNSQQFKQWGITQANLSKTVTARCVSAHQLGPKNFVEKIETYRNAVMLWRTMTGSVIAERQERCFNRPFRGWCMWKSDVAPIESLTWL